LLTRSNETELELSPGADIALKNKKNLAHPTRFERVTFAFGGKRSCCRTRWESSKPAGCRRRRIQLESVKNNFFHGITGSGQAEKAGFAIPERLHLPELIEAPQNLQGSLRLSDFQLALCGRRRQPTKLVFRSRAAREA
jgi:hypothetical protein